MHHVNVNVPLFILFRYSDLKSDAEIFEAIRGGSPMVTSSKKSSEGAQYECYRLEYTTVLPLSKAILMRTRLSPASRRVLHNEAYNTKPWRR
jgi:hypothetical protein